MGQRLWIWFFWSYDRGLFAIIIFVSSKILLLSERRKAILPVQDRNIITYEFFFDKFLNAFFLSCNISKKQNCYPFLGKLSPSTFFRPKCKGFSGKTRKKRSLSSILYTSSGRQPRSRDGNLILNWLTSFSLTSEIHLKLIAYLLRHFSSQPFDTRKFPTFFQLDC